MHSEILSQTQHHLLPLLSDFKRSFYLVGGTAIALQIGHRRSIDFDLFKYSPLRPNEILRKIDARKVKYTVTRRVEEQLNLLIEDVKFTFFQYPFHVEAPVVFTPFLKMPTLLDLAAMKAYALGRRAKWKDYVDLYFILKEHHSIPEITARATVIFGQLYAEKQFRAQLMYFDDIDYTEEIEWLTEPVSPDQIKEELIQMALSF
jgi:hypothetical protein